MLMFLTPWPDDLYLFLFFPSSLTKTRDCVRGRPAGGISFFPHLPYKLARLFSRGIAQFLLIDFGIPLTIAISSTLACFFLFRYSFVFFIFF